VRHISSEEFSKTIVAEKRLGIRIRRGALYDFIQVDYNSKFCKLFLHCFRSISRDSLVIGALSADPAKFTKDYCGLFTDSGSVVSM